MVEASTGIMIKMFLASCLQYLIFHMDAVRNIVRIVMIYSVWLYDKQFSLDILLYLPKYKFIIFPLPCYTTRSIFFKWYVKIEDVNILSIANINWTISPIFPKKIPFSMLIIILNINCYRCIF
jgi:hypothetical protein